MAYLRLYCPCCDQTAWLDPAGGPRCDRCGSSLAPMPPRRAQLLGAAVRARYAHDMRGDSRRPRFVRG